MTNINQPQAVEEAREAALARWLLVTDKAEARSLLDSLEQAVREDYTRLVEAAQALSDGDPPLVDGEMGYCLACGSDIPMLADALEPERHKEDCSWMALRAALDEVSDG